MNLTIPHIKNIILSLWFAGLLYAGCRDPYKFNILGTDTNFLVVEGIVNPIGETSIRLSRSIKLNGKEDRKGELKAQMQLEGENNTVYKFTEKSSGFYTLPNQSLSKSQKYRLRIKTTDLKEYLSEYVPVLNTPPVDNITWKRTEDGVQIYASTHDDLSNSRYYKMDSYETWEIHSADLASYNVVKVPLLNIVNRDPKEIPLLYTCWGNDTIPSASLPGTVNLVDNIVSNTDVMFIPNGSEKFSVRCSMMIRQYSITQEAHKFFDLMKKTTEIKGSVFDSQPATLFSNIHRSDGSSQTVIGYFCIASPAEKRIFIEASQLPGWYFDGCPIYYFDDTSVFYSDQYLPVTVLKTLTQNLWVSYDSPCVDCRLKGTNVKPVFW